MNQTLRIALLHGHGVDASVWNDIDAGLRSVGPVLKPDFSRLTNHKTIRSYADELYDRMQTARVENVVLVGHSMGGYVALAFAERYPALVRGLVLYHSTATDDDEPKKAQRHQTIEDLKKEGAVPFIQKTIPKMVAPNYPADKTRALIERFQHLPADALAAGMRAMMARPDRTAVLCDAQFPVLLVLSRDDQLIPYEKTAQLANLSPRISVATIERAGHLSMVEQPQVSLDVLRSFLTYY